MAVQVFAAMGPANAPRLDQVAVRWPAVAFAAASAAGVALVLSLLTAWGTRSVRIAEALSDGTRGGTSSRRQMRARELLIVAQVALTMVLLAGAGLLARSFALAMAVDPGFRVGDDLGHPTVHRARRRGWSGPPRVAPGGAARTPPRASGVVNAGLINAFPLGGGPVRQRHVRRDDAARRDHHARAVPLDAPQFKGRVGEAEFRAASAGYFEAMGIPLLPRPRCSTPADGPGPRTSP